MILSALLLRVDRVYLLIKHVLRLILPVDLQQAAVRDAQALQVVLTLVELLLRLLD